MSDETGTCKFFFRSEIKKFIQEGKVYTGENVIVEMKDKKIVLELAKYRGDYAGISDR